MLMLQLCFCMFLQYFTRSILFVQLSSQGFQSLCFYTFSRLFMFLDLTVVWWVWCVDNRCYGSLAVCCSLYSSSMFPESRQNMKFCTFTCFTCKRPCFAYPKGKPPFRLLGSFKVLREGVLQPPPRTFNLSNSTIFNMQLSSNQHSHEVLLVSGASTWSQCMARCCGGLWALTGVPLNELFWHDMTGLPTGWVECWWRNWVELRILFSAPTLWYDRFGHADAVISSWHMPSCLCSPNACLHCTSSMCR